LYYRLLRISNIVLLIFLRTYSLTYLLTYIEESIVDESNGTRWEYSVQNRHQSRVVVILSAECGTRLQKTFHARNTGTVVLRTYANAPAYIMDIVIQNGTAVRCGELLLARLARK